MSQKILINSRTSGKYAREVIEGRSHLVTTMMPIRGDITMNNIFYSNAAVDESFMQLNMLPAPHGHPVVNGIKVPAFHPIANNKHNIGGFLRNPRKKGKRVYVDFLLDETVASNSDEGKETIRRIEAGEKIGVSTGLTATSLTNSVGEDDFGKPYEHKIGGIQFDHVAILLNEVAAGEHAGTELILNEKGEEISVVEMAPEVTAPLVTNEKSLSQIEQAIKQLLEPTFASGAWVWVRDLYPESKTFIFTVEDSKAAPLTYRQSYAIDSEGEVSILGDRQEGTIEQVFNPKQHSNAHEEIDMDKSKLVLAIIANSANAFTLADNDRLNAMSEDDLLKIVSQGVDAEQAKAILANSGFDLEGYDAYLANKAGYQAFLANEETRLQEKREKIVANSTFTVEMVANKSEQELDTIIALLPADNGGGSSNHQHNQRAQEQAPRTAVHNNAADSKEPAVNYN